MQGRPNEKVDQTSYNYIQCKTKFAGKSSSLFTLPFPPNTRTHTHISRKILVFRKHRISLYGILRKLEKDLKQTLINTTSFFNNKCCFDNLVFKQDIGMPMGIDAAPFWANLLLEFFLI